MTRSPPYSIVSVMRFDHNSWNSSLLEVHYSAKLVNVGESFQMHSVFGLDEMGR